MRLWHTICIPFFTSGCLILSGPWGYYRNSLPEVEIVSPEGAIVMDSQRKTVLVEFHDVDEDDLIFRWFVEDEPQGIDSVNDVSRTDLSDGRFIQGSVLTLTRDDVTDGTPVSCFVEDGSEAIRLDWTVILQEGT
ncbi:MAG: hypothetical protein AB8H79_25240 [Myxococcota bacterium]